jgi:glycosyltransferase involved in cell wall biosynthesis
MKILIFGPKEPMGGVETIVLAYAKRLISYGCDCDFLFYESYPTLEKIITDMGGKVLHAASRRANYSQYKADVSNIFKTKYDAVWCNFSGLTNIDLLKLAKKAKVPVRIVHSHTSALSWGSPLMRILVPLMHYKNKPVINKYATDIWACSLKSGHFMYPKKVWNKIKVWNNAVDLSAFYPDDALRAETRQAFGVENKLVIGHIGRSCREKNQHFLLNAYKEFLITHPNTHLIFLSDASNDTLVNFAKELNIENNITFLTGKQHLAALYNAMDVFFLPSIVEGLPLTIFEAQACGIPCVVSTGVSQEGNITGFVNYISLESDFKVWCDALENSAQKRIENPKALIIENNYDINTESKKMYAFFEENL